MIDYLKRINELAKKDKEVGLTNAEKVEQQVLREDYLREIRGQVETTMTSVTVVDEEGRDVTPDKLKEKKGY